MIRTYSSNIFSPGSTVGKSVFDVKVGSMGVLDVYGFQAFLHQHFREGVNKIYIK